MNLAIYFPLFLCLIPIYFLLTMKTSKRLPPGDMGIPIIGQSLSLVRAMRSNTGEEWLQERIRKYGPVSRMYLFGKPTVFLHGQAANKFIYTSDDNTLTNQQPSPIRRICGERNIMELCGLDHKRIRGAVVSFLKPEVLKQYVGKMDEEVRRHLKKNWQWMQKISAMPLMKNLTFNVMSSLIFGIEEEDERNKLVESFQHLMEGILSLPINLPFTRFNRSLKARAKIRSRIIDLIREKRAALKEQKAFPEQDLITTLLSLRKEDNSAMLSDEEIIDNIIVLMIAGHDTTSILLTFLIRLLGSDPSLYASVLQEQEEIAKSKASMDLLTWEDITKMKYTWRVAMESLRMNPPGFCSFKKVLQDFEYEGYLIPKGWQVFSAACMTHMDRNIYADSTKFDPTRFEKPTVTPYSFVAFGGGSRICPGSEFVRIETLVAMHYLVTQFKWKLCCPDDMSFSLDPMPTFKRGLEIHVEPKVSCT